MTTDIFTVEDIQDIYNYLSEMLPQEISDAKRYAGERMGDEAEYNADLLKRLIDKIKNRYSWDVYGNMTDLKTGEIVGD